MAHPSIVKMLKIILCTLAIFTFGVAFIPEITPFLALSTNGIEHHFYWQFLTYSLFELSYNKGISFSLFIQLGFCLYVLWICTSSLVERLGKARFIGLFLGSVLMAGFGAWGTLKGLRTPSLFASLTPLVYTVFFAWALLNSQANIFLFFVAPLNAKRAVQILIGIGLLINASERNWPAVAALLASVSYTYVFIRFYSPSLIYFPFLRRLEWSLIRWKNLFKNKATSNTYQYDKIYDIRSGKPILDDERFMDAMLKRISLYGKEAISPEDQKRMRKISERKSTES